MLTVTVVSVGAIVASRLLRHSFGAPRALLAAALLGLASVLWLASTRLHAAAIRKAARGLSREPGAARGVPRWIEELRNVAFGLALAGLVPLVDELVSE